MSTLYIGYPVLTGFITGLSPEGKYVGKLEAKNYEWENTENQAWLPTLWLLLPAHMDVCRFQDKFFIPKK